MVDKVNRHWYKNREVTILRDALPGDASFGTGIDLVVVKHMDPSMNSKEETVSRLSVTTREPEVNISPENKAKAEEVAKAKKREDQLKDSEMTRNQEITKELAKLKKDYELARDKIQARYNDKVTVKTESGKTREVPVMNSPVPVLSPDKVHVPGAVQAHVPGPVLAPVPAPVPMVPRPL